MKFCVLYRELSASVCGRVKIWGFLKAGHSSPYPALRVSWERIPER